MDIKQLLADSKAQYEALQEKYDALTNEIKQLKEAGETLDESQVIIDLKNEIADLETKVKDGYHIKDDKGKSIRDYSDLVVGKFLKQAYTLKAEGGDEVKGFDAFVKMEVKTLNLTNSGEGAEAVAEVLSRQITERAREAYPILQAIGRRNMPRNLREEVLLTFPSVQEGIENVAGTKIAETKTQTYGEVKNRVAKLNAKPRITDEAMFGSDLDLYGHLLKLLDDEIGRYLVMQCLFGNGTGKNMRGILSSKRFSVAESYKPTFDDTDPRPLDYYPAYRTGVDGALPAEDIAIANWLIDFITELPTKYLPKAKFYMTRKTAKIFRKVRDKDGNKLLVKSDAGKGMSLEGYPVVIDDYMPEIASDSTFMIFGDLGEAFTISDGDIKKMLLDPYTVDGCTVVKVDQEYFEMVGKNDAIIIAQASDEPA